MERYTTGQILNERIRELKELRDEANKFKELVVYNKDKYVPDNNFSILVRDDNTKLLIGQDQKLKGIRKIREQLIRKYYPYWLAITCPISIDLNSEIQEEYRDNHGDIIFMIADVKEFKNRLKELSNSPLVKELEKYSKAKGTISSVDQQVDLTFYLNHINLRGYDIEMETAESRFIKTYGPTWTQEMLDRLIFTEFSEKDLSDYLCERMDANSNNDYTFELIDENPKYFTTAQQLGYFRREIDNEKKRILFHSYDSRMR